LSFSSRKYNHFRLLKLNKHHSKHLQSAYNKHGIDNFVFEVLEYCLPEYCISTEQFWMNMLNSCNDKYGYNMLIVAGNSKGYKRSKESIEKTASKNRGRKMSLEQKEILRKVHTGKTVSQETRDKISKAHKGKKLTLETITKLSLQQQKPILQYDLFGNFIKEWPSALVAGDQLNIPSTNINMNIRNKIGKAGNYYWRYKLIQNFPTKIDFIYKLRHFNKIVIQMDLDGKFIKEHSSIKEAGILLKVDVSSITKCCKYPNKNKTAGGFKWKYK